MSKKPAATKPKRVDWEAVERDYRAGKLTLREMADKHGCTNGRVCQVAKAKGWHRGDLQAVVRKATQTALIEQELSAEVSRVKQGLSETVAAEVELNARVIRRHRGDIERARDLTMALLDELVLHTHRPDVLEDLAGRAVADGGGSSQAKARLLEKVNDVLSVHNRVASVNRIADTLKKLQEQERKAHNLDDPPPPTPPDPSKFEGNPQDCYMDMIRG